MFIYSFFFISGKNGRINDLNGVSFFSATKKLNPTIIVNDILKENNVLQTELPKTELPKTELQIENISEYQAYKKRKNDSISIVGSILESMPDWKKYFISHPKKDDLADALLQGIAQFSKL